MTSQSGEKQMHAFFSLQTLLFISRILVGLLFIFSGFVKGIDPLGSTYKFSDYFDAFGMTVFMPMAFYLAVLLNAAEFIIGVALLAGYRIRFFSWVVLGFMCFFLPLTFFIAIFNPVPDCGCFGDALIISNWETFWKNVVILFFVLLIVKYRKQYQAPIPSLAQWGFIGGLTILFLWFSFYNSKNLPLMDFRPYSVGANFEEGMRIPEGALQDEYETIFFYRNMETGKVKRFTAENYPWQDTLNWAFESYDTRLVRRGYSPPITNFSLQHDDLGDVTDLFVSNPDYSFLLVAYDLEAADEATLEKMNAYYAFAEGRDDYSFYATTASSGRVVERTIDRLGLHYTFHMTDEITQKTIIRANPGLLFVADGTILGKWHFNRLPDIAYFEEYAVAKQVRALRQANEKNVAWLLFLGFVLLLILYQFVVKWSLVQFQGSNLVE